MSFGGVHSSYMSISPLVWIVLVTSSSSTWAYQESTQTRAGSGRAGGEGKNRSAHRDSVTCPIKKGRRVFLGVSLEGGGGKISTDKGRYSYSIGPGMGHSVEVARYPFAIEFSKFRFFSSYSEESIPGTLNPSVTTAKIDWINLGLKLRMVKTRNEIWIGSGLNFSVFHHTYEPGNETEPTSETQGRRISKKPGLGYHFQCTILRDLKDRSGISLNLGYHKLYDIDLVRPARPSTTCFAPDDYTVILFSVKWMYYLYDSSRIPSVR